jgi:hypothetical protein
MVVNFMARGISRGARKLARTPTLNKKKLNNIFHIIHATKIVVTFMSHILLYSIVSMNFN